jgi:hypothetical protein
MQGNFDKQFSKMLGCFDMGNWLEFICVCGVVDVVL